jgi:hypothetical protein
MWQTAASPLDIHFERKAMTEHTIEPLEQREAQERMLEEHARSGGTVPWIRQLALATALYAVLAASSGLVASKQSEEALLTKTDASIAQTEAAIAQNEAADWWAYSQAKSVKKDIWEAETSTLTQAGAPAAILAEIQKKRQDAITKQNDGETKAKAAEKVRDKHLEEAQKHDRQSKDYSRRHTIFAGAVTLFQVAIGLAAIAALTRLMWAFYGSLVLGVLGLLTMLWGGTQFLGKH